MRKTTYEMVLWRLYSEIAEVKKHPIVIDPTYFRMFPLWAFLRVYLILPDETVKSLL